MFDTHAHLNFKAFEHDADEVIKESLALGMEIIVVGADLATSRRAVELAKKYSGVWAAVGLHPIHLADRDWRSEIQGIRGLVEKEKKIVAVGETGYDSSPRGGAEADPDKQEIVFDFFAQVAKENKKPLIIHCRGAAAQMLRKIKDVDFADKFVWHCFGEDAPTALEVVKAGGLISFTGNITFLNRVHPSGGPTKSGDSSEVEKVIKIIPLDKIMAETDCPYLSPEPYRGQRNEPKYVEQVIRRIAALKNVSFKECDRQLDENAHGFFNLTNLTNWRTIKG